MDSLSISAAAAAPPVAPQPPTRRPVTPERPTPSALAKGDTLDLSDDLKLNDYSADLKSTRDEFIGYRQMWATSKDRDLTLYGVQYGRGKDLKEFGPLRLGYQWSGTFAAAGSGLHLGADVGGKAFLGTEKTTERFLPGMPVPVGVYVAAGPSLNLSNFRGNTGFGAGVYGAAGVDLFGFNFEVRQDLASNYKSLGIRGGFQIRF